MLLAAFALAASTTAAPAWVLDDFEKDFRTAAHGLTWIPLSDALFGGASSARLERVAAGSGHALRLSGRVAGGPRPLAGAWTALDGGGRTADVTAFDGLRLRVRGRGRYQAGVRVGPPTAMANFMAGFEATPEWTVVELPFSSLAPSGPAAANAKWEPTLAHWLGVTASGAGPFALEIDEVALTHGGRGAQGPTAAPGPPRTLRFSAHAAPDGSWEELGQDASGDGKAAALPDVISVSVLRGAKDGRVWFRLRLAGAVPPAGFGLNLALDTDGDPANGMAWWGVNKAFHFDHLATLWAFATGGDYQGVAGLASAAEVQAGELAGGGTDVRLALDRGGHALLLGVPRALLGAGPVRLVAAVGSAMVHNDDLPDEGALRLRP